MLKMSTACVVEHDILLDQLDDPSILSASLSSQDSATDAITFPVYNPASPSQIVAQVTEMNDVDAREQIDRSSSILASWRDSTTALARGNLLTRWSALIKEHSKDIATIMTMESGKPINESLGEVGYAASFVDYYAAEAVRPTGAGGGFLVPSPFATPQGAPKGQLIATQQAVGVTGLITPWNFPAAMITRKVAPALAAGCTAIVKPSELTPLTAIALKNLSDRAGIPEDVFQLVTASKSTTPKVGTELCTNPNVRKISFTGSTRVGKELMKLSSDTMKRLSLELGGNAPFIVFDDADMDQAVAAAVASKFRNTGQTCVCADRFLVHESVFDEFCDRFAAEARSLKVGDGMDPTCKVGPLITENAAASVDAKVRSAIEAGAECLAGGKPLHDAGTHFYAPTVLRNVPRSEDLWKTETFGPVACINSFESEEEAIRTANDVEVGLAGYFCTRDLSRALRCSQRLECGLVGVNEGVISTAVAPFGGIKESGLGREGSPLGMAEYLETKYVYLNTI